MFNVAVQHHKYKATVYAFHQWSRCIACMPACTLMVTFSPATCTTQVLKGGGSKTSSQTN
jgi:hypothetical protein